MIFHIKKLTELPEGGSFYFGVRYAACGKGRAAFEGSFKIKDKRQKIKVGGILELRFEIYGCPAGWLLAIPTKNVGT